MNDVAQVAEELAASLETALSLRISGGRGGQQLDDERAFWKNIIDEEGAEFTLT